ncbi:unnamed protein product [Effrenium voratum]|nr:unnamed protein product [Effrenium voratum]
MLSSGKAHKQECARMRCLERSCELRTDEEKLRLQEHADPMEDIIEEDLDCGTANSLEEAAGFFSEHESEDELLPPKGQRDYLNLSLVELFPWSRPKALYVGLYRDLGKVATADGIVVISTSAHPAAYIAARELDRECHVLCDRPSQHSVEHGKRIAAGMWRGAYLTKHADPAAGQGKRKALDDVQAPGVAKVMAGPTYPPDSLYYMLEIEPPAADTWGGVDFVPTDLAAKAPALLASELDSCKLEITSPQAGKGCDLMMRWILCPSEGCGSAFLQLQELVSSYGPHFDLARNYLCDSPESKRLKGALDVFFKKSEGGAEPNEAKGPPATELKAATQQAVHQTKEAFSAEAKLVARDMQDLKDGVKEGVRLTVQDTGALRERLGQQTRKVFAREESDQQRSADGDDSTGAEKPKSFLSEADLHQLKGKVEDLKAGGKKAAEKVKDVGGKLWHKTDHWLQSLREAGRTFSPRGWEECHQRALQLSPGVGPWALEELRAGSLAQHAKTAVVFFHGDRARVEALLEAPQRDASTASTASTAGYSSYSSQPMPNMALFCRTPLVLPSGERLEVNVLSAGQLALDDPRNPEHGLFFPVDDQKWQALTARLHWLCACICECARQRRLSSIFVALGDGSSEPYDFQRLRKESLAAAAAHVEVRIRPPDLSAEGAAAGLFIHTGSLWSSDVGDQLTTCSALALLCCPATNPHLSFQAFSPAVAEELARAPSAPNGSASPVEGGVVIEDDADLSDGLLDKEIFPPAGSSSTPAATATIATAVDDGADWFDDLQNGQGTSQPGAGSSSGPAATTEATAVDDGADWFDDLQNGQGTSQPGVGATPAPAATAATAADDFDELWDSMMDEVARQAEFWLKRGIYISRRATIGRFCGPLTYPEVLDIDHTPCWKPFAEATDLLLRECRFFWTEQRE